MSDRYLIEFDEVEAGLLLRQGAGWVFHAVDERFRRFEGTAFSGLWAAERVLRAAAEGRTLALDAA